MHVERMFSLKDDFGCGFALFLAVAEAVTTLYWSYVVFISVPLGEPLDHGRFIKEFFIGDSKCLSVYCSLYLVE